MWGKKKKTEMRVEETNSWTHKIYKLMYKIVVLHENMTPKEISNIEELLNEERYYITRPPIKISDTQSLLFMEYSVLYEPKETEEL